MRVFNPETKSGGPSTIAGVLRIWVIGHNTTREALRQRLVPFTLLLTAALVIGLGQLRELTFGASELKFIVDVGFGAMGFFGAVLTIALTAQLFFNELEQRTVLTLLAKPVNRADFVLGKFVGAAQVSGFFCAALGLVLITMFSLREHALARQFDSADVTQVPVRYAAMIVAVAAQWLKLLVISASTLLVASFARTQLFTLATSFLLWVICHLQDLAQTAVAHGGFTLSRIVLRFVTLVGPNFRLFDFSGAITGETPLVSTELLRVAVYAGGYLALYLGLAVFLFRDREL